jgi:hypothetical protein
MDGFVQPEQVTSCPMRRVREKLPQTDERFEIYALECGHLVPIRPSDPHLRETGYIPCGLCWLESIRVGYPPFLLSTD